MIKFTKKMAGHLTGTVKNFCIAVPRYLKKAKSFVFLAKINEMSMRLYFIAVIPDNPLCERITKLKRALRESFGVHHALKSPPHITLMMPFRYEDDLEGELKEPLNDLVQKQSPFEVNADGFGVFEPRVIYIKIAPNDRLQILHRQLKQVFYEKPGFNAPNHRERFHPHITLATRDVKPDVFYRIRELYRNREFHAVFKVDRLWLLKHNGKFWEKYQPFVFTG